MSARKQWATDQTGELASYNMPQMIGFIRSSTILAGEEFGKLGEESQRGLTGETKPTYEIISVRLILFIPHSNLPPFPSFPPFLPILTLISRIPTPATPLLLTPPPSLAQQGPHPSIPAPHLYLATAVAFHATESSTGSVTLSSSNPTDAPLINPNFLAHPFDRHLAINAVREAMELLEKPELAEDVVRVAEGPGGKGDEEILVC